MKSFRKNIFTLLLLGIIFLPYSCSKQGPEINEVKEQSFSIDEDFRFVNLESTFNFHNQIMDEILEKEINYTGNNQEDIKSILSSIEAKTNYIFSEEEVAFVKKMHNDYLALETPAMIIKLKNDKIMSQEAADVLLAIDNYMSGLDLTNYSQIAEELNNVQENYIDNNSDLSDFDRHQLSVFIQTVNNSAFHYKDYYERGNNGYRNCRRCLSEHLWQILLADGAGLILGGVACVIWPPACPVLLPTLTILGSGLAVLMYCGGC